MHIHLTRGSSVLARFEVDGRQKWREISIEELVDGLESMRGMSDVVVYYSADDPEEFSVNPPARSREIVELIWKFKIPFKFLGKPIVPLDGATPKKASHDPSRILRASALIGGDVLVDGCKSTMDELHAALATLAKKNGVVWYYRENPLQEPPAQGSEVLEAIMKYKCPISMSSRADFSDVIDAGGESSSRS